MAVNVTSNPSGIDTNALIESLMNIERLPLSVNQQEQSTTSSAKDTISSIMSNVSALKSAATALSERSGFSSYAATSSDTAVVSTVTGSPTTGTYEFDVTQLAKAQRTYSNTFSDSTTALEEAGFLRITSGSDAPIDIDVNTSDSLSDIAAKIEASAARVAATVIYDGTNYRLQIKGLDTGADSVVQLDQVGFDLGLETPANTTQAAQDAQIVMDGITYTRSTNSISDIITGVTLALKAETTSSATVTVATDSTELAAKITTFVTAYNAVVSSGHLAAGYGSLKASNSLLSADSSIRSTLSSISSALGTSVSGITGKYTTLSSVGITSTTDGSISFNSATLEAALEDNTAGVEQIFLGVGSTSGVMETISDMAASLVDNSNSVLRSRYEGLTSRITKLETDEEKLTVRLDLYEESLRSKFAALESLMSTIQAQSAAITNSFK